MPINARKIAEQTVIEIDCVEALIDCVEDALLAERERCQPVIEFAAHSRVLVAFYETTGR